VSIETRRVVSKKFWDVKILIFILRYTCVFSVVLDLEAIRSLVIGVASRYSHWNVTVIAYSCLIRTKNCHNLVFKVIDYKCHYFYYG